MHKQHPSYLVSSLGQYSHKQLPHSSHLLCSQLDMTPPLELHQPNFSISQHNYYSLLLLQS
ncbi:hypothetical protein LINPERPRIM_LOCUS27948 [Linum perenne]